MNLMDKESKLYQKHAKKYEGREVLMKEIIPRLNCLWNDVVQFSALDPKIILEALAKYQPDISLKRQYYKVPIDKILGKYEAVIYDRTEPRIKGDYAIADDEVSLLSHHYQEIHHVPEQTELFWQKALESKKPLLWFPFVPHIFVKGEIETSDFELCDLVR
ncbi:hypothetical protein M901_0294 [Bacteriovorax sp. DB6_IX]|nr:hypothetical protein M901_0294 [Bacteriovorax sp. DB6_IX]